MDDDCTFRYEAPAVIDSEDEDQDVAIVRSHAVQLSEHFDTVQILCTRTSGDVDGTVNVSWGEGNFFARYGQVREWIVKQDERTRIMQRRRDEGCD